jgi:hypothetical protein
VDLREDGQTGLQTATPAANNDEDHDDDDDAAGKLVFAGY